MAINTIIYDTRDMLEAIRYSNEPSTFLLGEIIQGTRTHATTKIEVDVDRGGQRVAAYVSRRGDPEDVAKLGYDSKLHVMPYTKQRMILTPEDLETRTAGNTVYETGTPATRQAELMGGFLRELDNRIVRLEELQVAEALTSGTCTVLGNGVDYTVDYGRNANNEKTLTAGDRWSESTSNIRGDFRTATAQIRSVGARELTDVVLGTTAVQYYIADTEIQGLLDNRRMDVGEINIQYYADRKASYIGMHRDAGVNINVWCYHGTYRNSSGTEVPYVNANDALFFGRGLRATAHYSMISNFHSGNFVGRRYPRQYIPESGDRMVVTLESGPLMAVHEIDSTYSLHTAG